MGRNTKIAFILNKKANKPLVENKRYIKIFLILTLLREDAKCRQRY